MLAKALSAQSEKLAGQTEVLAKLMATLEVMEQASRKPSAVRSYREVVRQTLPVGPVPVVRRPLTYFRCGGPHLKKECPQFPGTGSYLVAYMALGKRGRVRSYIIE